MKVRFTGNAEASVTYLGKYQVENGTVLENVSEADGNTLLQTGHFEVLEVPNKDETGVDAGAKKSDSKKDSK